MTELHHVNSEPMESDDSFKSTAKPIYENFFKSLLLNIPYSEVLRGLEREREMFHSSPTVALCISVPETLESMFQEWKNSNKSFFTVGSLTRDGTEPNHWIPEEKMCSTLKQLLRNHVTELLTQQFSIAQHSKDHLEDVQLEILVHDHLGSHPTACPQDLLQISVTRFPYTFEGYYTKSQRNLCQTKYHQTTSESGNPSHPFVNMGSVEEYIGDPLLSYLEAASYRFHAAGREDHDVRMLGQGRPFIISLMNPRKIIPKNTTKRLSVVQHLQETINSSGEPKGVKIHKLCLSESYSETNAVLYRQIHTLAQDKQKIYGCVCYIPAISVDEAYLVDTLQDILSKGISIQQKTPTRVAHRRSHMTRERFVQCQDIACVGPHLFFLKLLTQAGTYVKEFVHGDFGRTTPSLSSLFKSPIHLLALDVLSLLL